MKNYEITGKQLRYQHRLDKVLSKFDSVYEYDLDDYVNISYTKENNFTLWTFCSQYTISLETVESLINDLESDK